MGPGRQPRPGGSGAGAHLTGHELRSPRAAAFAGIIFSVLFSSSFVMLLRAMPDAAVDTGAWIATDGGRVSLALGLLPVAGIAFLWFMAVVRDRMGHLEDQFFSTLFFGSGILYLAMTFFAAALYGAAIAQYELRSEVLLEEDIYVSARMLAQKITTAYMVRMAGMFMFVLGTIWLRTRLMPRWLVLVTYVLALVLLVSIEFTRWLMLLFPAWVLLVSLYILHLDFFAQGRRQRGDGMTPDD